MCCGLQQVSPNRDRPFEIIDLDGIEPDSMEFLNAAPDKVEIILQWIQRSMVLHQQTGVLPVAPPILSRIPRGLSRDCQSAKCKKDRRLSVSIPSRTNQHDLATTALGSNPICYCIGLTHGMVGSFLFLLYLRALVHSLQCFGLGVSVREQSQRFAHARVSAGVEQ